MTEPVRPGLSFAFRIEAQIAKPLSGGKSPHGERLHIPILGGTVAGPKLTGEVLSGGSDWPLIRPDGNSEIFAKYTIKANDGALILVENNGIRVSEPGVLQRLRSGEAVSPDEYYFRSVPRFEAPDGPHGWLNRSLFVASLAPSAGKVIIDVYALD